MYISSSFLGVYCSDRLYFFQDLDLQLFVRKKLVLDAFFQIVDIFLVNQTGALQIHADLTSVPGAGHLVHLHQIQEPAQLIRDL